MEYSVAVKNGKKYIKCFSSAPPIHTERDVLDLISKCFENDIDLLMLNSDTLSPDFFRLKTGVAGMLLQKLTNYHIKLAIVIEDESKIEGRFKELVTELNKGNDFRVFPAGDEAEQWLLS